MPNSLQDIPLQCRGTINIGGRDYHYVRLTRTGNLAIAPGPDRRDWDAIDAGALDYTVIAQQEHDQPGFEGHDGPKIAAACPLCNGFTAVNDAATARARLAADTPTPPDEPNTDDSTPTPAGPPTDQVVLDANRRAREAEARAAQLQARLDQAEKAALKEDRVSTPAELGITGAADPQHNAGVPPTDPDVVAGAAPEVKAQVHLPAGPQRAPVVWGTDPWTGEKVRVTRQEGADETAPYGRKKDGTPRRPGGRAKDA